MVFEFGEETTIPDSYVLADSDAECAELWASGAPQVVLGGGDLAEVLGSRDTTALPGTAAIRCLIDVIQISGRDTSGSIREFHAVSSCCFGSWWFGEVDVVTSTGRHDGLEANPRAHPGDGLLDHLHVVPQMKLRQRWQCRRKMRTGSHLPHPDLQVLRSTDFDFKGPRKLTVDGIARGQFVSVSCRILPEALMVIVPLPVIDIAKSEEV